MTPIVRALIFLFLFGVSPVTGHAAPESAALAQIEKRLAAHDVFRAAFHQERNVEVLSRPLTSDGRVLVSRDKGIAWLTDKPYPDRMVLTPGHVIEWDEGEERRKTPLSARPGLSGFASVVVPVLSQNLGKLEEIFDIMADLSEESWRVRLIPKHAGMARAVDTVTLKGDTHLRSVRLNETSGDVTTIRFSDYSHEPPGLTSAERRYFAE